MTTTAQSGLLEKLRNLPGAEALGAQPMTDRSRSNRAIIYTTSGKIELQDIGFPRMVDPTTREEVHHGVIIKVVVSNICGSDLHMYRGRTGATGGVCLGHEVTGEVIEIGRNVKNVKVGDLVSVPFNIACGSCANCKDGHTSLCGTTNSASQGGIYGYILAGGWVGGQAEYMFVPWADFNLLKFPDRQKAMEKMLDLTMLTDILPTGMHGCENAGVGYGLTVYIAGAGPVGLCALACCNLMGAAVVFISDQNPDRLELAKQMGAYTINLREIRTDGEISKEIEKVLGEGCSEVDCAIDCVGYEACGSGRHWGKNIPQHALNQCIKVVKAGGKIGVPGAYFQGDPKAPNKDGVMGVLPLSFGEAWMKGVTIGMGQTPVNPYNHDLMMAILHGKLSVAKALNVNVISLDEVPKAYDELAKGAPKKVVIDPHNSLGIRRDVSMQKS